MILFLGRPQNGYWRVADREDQYLTWADMTMTWEDALFTWSHPEWRKVVRSEVTI